jgi:DedD protein
MDHELKQRLIGAVVITALAAIFIPMLFDDPVDTSGKEVTQLAIPPAPPAAAPETAQNLPQNRDQVMNRTDTDLKVTEEDEDNQNSTLDSQNIPDESGAETGQTGLPENTNAPNSDIQNNQAVDAAKGMPAIHNNQPGLDTGYIDSNNRTKGAQTGTVNPVESEKAQQQTLTPVERSVANPLVTEKHKADIAQSKEKPQEKSKSISKSKGNKSAKTSSKMVRYSIQAGSFNKKENAEAMAAKLRKQGLPASIISKGEHFRVKVGPSLDKAKAKEMKAKMEKLNINGLLTLE